MEHNDYELVYLAQNGNEDAINIIYNKYKPVIIKKSKNAILLATHHGIDINDIMQEGYIGLDEAIKSFSQNTNASFYTFAILCIDRQILTYLRKITRGKNKTLNDAIALDEVLEKTIDDGTNLEMNYIYKVTDSEIIQKLKEKLTDFEKKVFDLRVNGYGFDEIAKILNKDLKSIYNTFQRIKIKFKKIKENDN